jgi:outer membrane protein TolC
MKHLTLIRFLIAAMLSVCIFWPAESKASVTDSLSMAADSGGFLPLPPLDTLILWAKLHSPLVNEQDALIAKNTADAHRMKKILLDAVKLNSGFQYGNYGDPTVNKLSTGWQSGLSVQFSLYQLFGFKDMVKVYNSEKTVSMYKKDEVEMDIAQLVTQLYNNVHGQKAILKIRSEGNYSAYTHMKMAEKEFNEGSVEVGELSRVTEIYTKAQVDYEQCVNDLKNYYMQLQIIVGVPFESYKQ